MATSSPESTTSMEDRGIAVAQLSVISLAKLHAGDLAELAFLKRAASIAGFFYLDLRKDTEGEVVLTHLGDVFKVAERYFSQPSEAKINDVRRDIEPSQDLGWKKGPSGESFEFSRDEMRLKGFSDSRMPRVFKDESKKITEFSAGCDEACLTLLNSLSTEFSLYHRVDQPSDTGLKLVSAPSLAKLSDVRESLHTDSGTITLLFYTEWGLHAFLRDAGIWAFIPPLDGCALINVGNSLQKISEERFHSPEHRVTQPFDGAMDRYYLSYFLRPETRVLEMWERSKQ